METLDHPAVAVAVDAVLSADPNPRPVAAIVRDDTVAVLVNCEQGRCVVFVQLRDGQWVAPSMIVGRLPTGWPSRGPHPGLHAAAPEVDQ